MDIKANDEVWTEDKVKLGVARSWHHRPAEDVRPKERLYAAYLEVENYDLGDTFYVPDIYLNADGDVVVEASFKAIQKLTWTRIPDFVARGDGHEELLAAETAAEGDDS